MRDMARVAFRLAVITLFVPAVMAGAGALFGAAAGTDDQARLTNAKFETHSAAAGLDHEVKAFAAEQEAPAWIGYATPLVDGRHSMCCWHVGGKAADCCGQCELEASKGTGWSDDECESGNGGVHLESPGAFFVLLRAADHRITRVRTFSAGCSIDAGGLRVLWLTGVKPSESVAVLSALVVPANFDDHDNRSPASGALAAIAMTADPAADRALEAFIAANQPEKLRSQTAFWLGSTRGASGLRLLESMAKNDPSTKVREQVAFAYTTSREPGATDDLIQLAKADESGRVRGQALFWLAQKAGHKAAGAITDAIANDPDMATKRQAVFALSQLPKDEGVPLLIQVAQTNKNPEVRKQAFFWLGQTNDPRALDFFEQVLKK